MHWSKKCGKTSFCIFENEFLENFNRVLAKNRVSEFSGKTSFGQNVQKKSL